MEEAKFKPAAAGIAGSSPPAMTLERQSSYLDSPQRLAGKRAHRQQPFIIGVAGGTASGKTTVCDLIIQRLQEQSVVMLAQVAATLPACRAAALRSVGVIVLPGPSSARHPHGGCAWPLRCACRTPSTGT